MSLRVVASSDGACGATIVAIWLTFALNGRRSLPPWIPPRQCAGGTRLPAVGGYAAPTHREG